MEIKNPAITIHNSCKKIAQLNKVIEHITGHFMEELYRIANIRQNIDADFQTLFKKHQEAMDPIINSLDTQKEEIGKAISELYTNQLDNLQKSYQKKRDKIHKRLDSDVSSLGKEFKSLQSNVFLINEEIEKQISLLSTQTSMQYIDTQLEQVNANFEKSKRTIDEETEKRISDLMKQAENKQKDMEKHFERVAEDIKMGMKEGQKASPEHKKSLMAMLKQRLEMSQEMSNAKKELSHQQSIAAQNFNAFKTRLDNIMKDIENAFKENQKEEQQQKDELKSYEDHFVKEIKEKKAELANDKRRHENEIIQMNNTQKLTKNKYKEQIEKLQKKISTQGNTLNEIDNIKNECKEEISKQKDEFNSIRKIKEEELINKEKELKENVSKYNNLLKEVKDKQENQRSEFKNEIQNKENQFSKEKEELFKELKKSKSSILEKMESAKKEKLLIDKKKAEFYALQDDLNAIVQPHDNDNPIVSLSNADIDELREKQQEEFNSAKQKYDDEIKKLREKFENEINEKEEKIISDHKRHMDKWADDFISNGQVQAILDEYKKKYAEITSELHRYSTNNEENKIDDNHEMDEWHSKLEQVKIKLNEERIRLINELKSQYEEEEKLIPPPYQETHDNRKINKIKAVSKSNVDKLVQQINDLQACLSELKSVKTKCAKNEDEEVARLKTRLAEMKAKSSSRIELGIQQAEKTIKALNTKLDLAKAEINEMLTKEEKHQEEEHKEFREEYNKNTKMRKKISIDYQSRIDNAKKYFEETLQDKKDHHENVIQSLNETIESIKLQSSAQAVKQKVIKEAKQQFENQYLSLKNSQDSQLAKLKEYKDSLAKGTQKIVDNAQHKRNNIINLAKTKPMRSEEEEIINELEKQYQEKTEELQQIGRDFLDYRSGLVIRDGQFNSRFQKQPANIAIMKPQKAKTVNLSRLRPLPPLAAQYTYL